jgi:hypothetical protein
MQIPYATGMHYGSGSAKAKSSCSKIPAGPMSIIVNSTILLFCKSVVAIP